MKPSERASAGLCEDCDKPIPAGYAIWAERPYAPLDGAGVCVGRLPRQRVILCPVCGGALVDDQITRRDAMKPREYAEQYAVAG